MKRVLIIFSLLIAATLFAHAQMRPDKLPPLITDALAGPPVMLQVAGAGVASGTCTEATSIAPDGAAVTNVSRYEANDQFVAGEFVAGDWAPITKIQWKGYEANGDIDAKTYTLALYSSAAPSAAGGPPDTSLGSCTFSGSLWGNGVENVSYVGCTLSSGVQLTNGTHYYVVISQPTFDGTNYPTIYYDSTASASLDMEKSGDGSTWAPVDNDAVGPTVKLWSGASCSGN